MTYGAIYPIHENPHIAQDIAATRQQLDPPTWRKKTVLSLQSTAEERKEETKSSTLWERHLLHAFCKQKPLNIGIMPSRSPQMKIFLTNKDGVLF
jgi:hypothetical protein